MADEMVLRDLSPGPQEEWQRMLRFVGWGEDEKRAASRSVEVLLRRSPDLVIQTYEYLRQVPETAAVLGWEQGVDEEHLEERRRFFTIWVTRTLGMDMSEEFASYLFRAGKYHAGHGPRHVHTPMEYVTGSIGLVLAAFARYMAEARLPGEVIAGAMAAWSKYLVVQLSQMTLGYRAAHDLSQGNLSLRCTLFGRLRFLLDRQEVDVHIHPGACVADVLTKFFHYYPETRAEMLERAWQSEERGDTLWVEVFPTYTPRPGWRVLLNGRDVTYIGGFAVPVRAGDEIALFPPAR